MATSVSQFGITWSFDTDYTTGQYANGDYYVVAPSGLTITSISPSSTRAVVSSSSVTISNGSPASIGWTGHGLRENTLVRFTTTGSLPTGLTVGTPYYVIGAGLTANAFRVSAAPSTAPGMYGSAVNTSSSGSGVHTASTERVKNGAMIDLATGFTNYAQGLDSAMYGTSATPGPFYSSALNVARPNDADLSVGNPLVVAADTSLVSCISKAAASTPGDRVQLEDTATLTVVSSAPASGSFRPPFFGSDKTHSWNVSDLNYTKLQSLAPVSGTPDIADVEALFAYPWWTAYFHCGSFLQNTSTSRNPSGDSGLYGREVANAVSDAVLSLNLDYTNEEKEALLISVVQMGIDIYGAVAFAGGEWKDNAGVLLGCKLPLVLAAIVLEDEDLLEYASGAEHQVFSEDLQSWYVELSDVGRVMYEGDGTVRQTYILADVGLPEAGQQHTRTPNLDGRNWDDPYMPYRDIIGASFVGNAISARLLIGGFDAWAWAPFFDYSDRYESDPINDLGSPIQTFHQNMWSAYRNAVEAPAFTPPGGEYDGNQSVEISCDTSGATIKYTLDGSDPSQSHGTVYSGPVGVAVDLEIRAIAYKVGLSDSPIASASYVITPVGPGPGVTAAGLNANRVNLA